MANPFFSYDLSHRIRDRNLTSIDRILKNVQDTFSLRDLLMKNWRISVQDTRLSFFFL